MSFIHTPQSQKWISPLLALTMLLPSTGLCQDGDNRAFEPKFIQAKLAIVLKEYGELAGRTILMAPEVNANTEITLRSQSPLTKQEYMNAIESMLAMSGIAIVPHQDKFLKVVPADAARANAMTTQIEPWGDLPPDTDNLISRVVVLRNMEVAEGQKIIDALKSKNGKVHALERINGLLVTDSSANISRILEILEHIDQPVETREQLFVMPIRHGMPSEIKAKLEEIMVDLKEEKTAAPTVALPRASGAPGVIRARPDAAPARAPVAIAGAEPEVERGIVRGKVKVVADDRTGILIIITRPSNMTFFEDIVKAFDVEIAPDVLVKVFRLEFADADSIAGMLNTLVGSAGAKDQGSAAAGAAGGAPGEDKGARGVALEEYVSERIKAMEDGEKSKVGELRAENIKILPDKRTNSLIIMASRSDLATIEEIIRDMDMMLSQVLIEAVIIEIDLGDTLKTGVDWIQRSLLAYKPNSAGGRSPVMSFAGRAGAGNLNPADATTTPAFPTGHGLTYFFTHYGLNIDMVVQAASTDDRTHIISSPVILTTDNTEAKITSTEQIYIFTGKKYDQYQNPYDDYTTKDIGLDLSVKPHINTNKVVMMEITQSMSQPGDVGAPQSGSKISSTRTLTASIAVRHGETIILGGQVRTEKGQSRDKVPLVGDIPLVGRLFNSSSDTFKRTEMIVFITPYVLDTNEEIEAEALRRRNALDIDGSWKRDWSNSKLAEPTAKQIWEEKRAAKELAREEARTRRAEKAAAAAAERDSRPQHGRASGQLRARQPVASTELSDEQVAELLLQNEARWSEDLKQVDALAVESNRQEK